jgi:hypothetical protein
MSMKNLLKSVRKGIFILMNRLRKQGVRTTLTWMYARGIPKLTGIPILKYSRITEQIFVGPQYRLLGKGSLEASGIHTCVNLRIEFDDREHGLALEHYCYLPTVDDMAPAIDQLHKGAAFISDAVQNGRKVYIHCAGGVGRAPTMAAAYFLSRGISLDQALGTIRKVRSFVNIMPGQMEQLQRFEKLHQKKDTSSGSQIGVERSNA